MSSNSNREVKRQKAANSSNRPRIRGRKKPANSLEFAKQLSEQPKPKKSVLPTPEEVRNHLKSNN